jgi:hypothetical protein
MCMQQDPGVCMPSPARQMHCDCTVTTTEPSPLTHTPLIRPRWLAGGASQRQQHLSLRQCPATREAASGTPLYSTCTVMHFEPAVDVEYSMLIWNYPYSNWSSIPTVFPCSTRLLYSEVPHSWFPCSAFLGLYSRTSPPTESQSWAVSSDPSVQAVQAVQGVQTIFCPRPRPRPSSSPPKQVLVPA